jgi:hypothetical protein
MDRRTRSIFVIGLLVLVGAFGVATYLLNADPDGSTTTESAIGVIVGVRSEGLDQVRGFDLRTGDGGTVEFVIGDLENGSTFPPGHLVEHQATGQPVRVSFVMDGATKVAIRIEDAP